MFLNTMYNRIIKKFINIRLSKHGTYLIKFIYIDIDKFFLVFGFNDSLY